MPTTNALMLKYEERAGAPMFLSGFFRAPSGRLLLSEKFKIQVRRSGRKVAVPRTSVVENGVENAASSHSDSDFAPVIYKEQVSVSADELWNQQFGSWNNEQPSYEAVQAAVIRYGIAEVQDKIRRSLELQASQVLATGALALTDETGATRFSQSFGPKAGHLITAGTSWASSTVKYNDLISAQEVNRVDGKATTKHLIFGERAWLDFTSDVTIQARLDNRRMDQGTIQMPSIAGKGGTYHGKFNLGWNEVSLWTYGASYELPNTGADTKYVNQDHVILLPDNPEFDWVFGAIPRVQAPNSAVGVFRQEIVMADAGLAFDTIQWTNNDRTAFTVQLALRAIAVPTGIDTFSRLQTR